MNELYIDRQGWIYLLTNPSMGGICKIGATRKHPIQRARELGAGTGVPTPYSLDYYRDFVDAFRAETLIHKRLTSCRVNESREFFKISTREAIEIIDEVAKIVQSEGLKGGQNAYRPKPIEEEYPWAALFNSFDQNGPLELTPEEQARCRALERSLQEKAAPAI